jgi:hypothetical protein
MEVTDNENTLAYRDNEIITAGKYIKILGLIINIHFYATFSTHSLN